MKTVPNLTLQWLAGHCWLCTTTTFLFQRVLAISVQASLRDFALHVFGAAFFAIFNAARATRLLYFVFAADSGARF